MGMFESILYVIEESGDRAQGVARAVDVAKRSGAALTILEVSPSGGGALVGVSPDQRMLALEAMVAGIRDDLRIQLMVLNGTLFLEVIRAVLRDGHDLVMKVAENPGFLNRLFGSTDLHLLRKCPCPLWLMKSPVETGYERVMAAVDFDPDDPSAIDQELNRTILDLAGSVALGEGASLHVVHAWDAYAELSMRVVSDVPGDRITAHVQTQQIRHEKGLNSLGEALRDRMGLEDYARVSPRFHLLKGSPRRMIAELADDLPVDLVVMGTVARTGVPGLIIGNTAETILNQLSCSVLAVKPPGFETPVKLDS